MGEARHIVLGDGGIGPEEARAEWRPATGGGQHLVEGGIAHAVAGAEGQHVVGHERLDAGLQLERRRVALPDHPPPLHRVRRAEAGDVGTAPGSACGVTRGERVPGHEDREAGQFAAQGLEPAGIATGQLGPDEGRHGSAQGGNLGQGEPALCVRRVVEHQRRAVCHRGEAAGQAHDLVVAGRPPVGQGELQGGSPERADAGGAVAGDAGVRLADADLERHPGGPGQRHGQLAQPVELGLGLAVELAGRAVRVDAVDAGCGEAGDGLGGGAPVDFAVLADRQQDGAPGAAGRGGVGEAVISPALRGGRHPRHGRLR